LNTDRKNLGKAWNWGAKYLGESGFPIGRANPFRSVEKYPEERHARYVPQEEDFWAVYEKSQGQDRVLLIAFLHLAARRGELFRLTWDRGTTWILQRARSNCGHVRHAEDSGRKTTRP